MHSVIRPLILFVMLVVIFRLTGKRSVGEITVFDFLLLLVVSEAASGALLADDSSFTGSLLAVITLVGCDVAMSLVKQRWPRIERMLDDVPVVLYQDGRLKQERLEKERIGVDDILEAARQVHGLERLDQIDKVVLERRGVISIIPRAAH